MKHKAAVYRILMFIFIFNTVSFVLAAQNYNLLEGKSYERKQDDGIILTYKFKKDGKIEWIMKENEGLFSFKWIYIGTYNQNADELNLNFSDVKFSINGINLTGLINNESKSAEQEVMKDMEEELGGKYLIEGKNLIFLNELGERQQDRIFVLK